MRLLSISLTALTRWLSKSVRYVSGSRIDIGICFEIYAEYENLGRAGTWNLVGYVRRHDLEIYVRFSLCTVVLATKGGVLLTSRSRVG